jgi:hypothetical protein
MGCVDGFQGIEDSQSTYGICRSQLQNSKTNKMKTHTQLLIAVIFAAFITTTYAGPSNWPSGYPTRVSTKDTVMKCCLPGEKVALACKDCKTVDAKKGEDKKNILAWFKPDSTHGCSGCGGKITVKQVGADKGAKVAEYKHVCSKCGENSAFTCATHKG